MGKVSVLPGKPRHNPMTSLVSQISVRAKQRNPHRIPYYIREVVARRDELVRYRTIGSDNSTKYHSLLDSWIEQLKPRLTLLRGDISQPPRYSVGVPIHNEAENVLLLLTGLSYQVYLNGPLEIRIIDNNSDESDPAAEIAERSGAEVTVVSDTQFKGPYLPRYRNMVANQAIEAGAELLLTTDGDCIPAPGWIASMTEQLRNPESPVAVSGGNINFYDDDKNGPLYAQAQDITREVGMVNGKLFAFSTQSLAFRARDFTRINGFAPDKYIGEDWDLAQRLGGRHGIGKAELMRRSEGVVYTSARRYKDLKSRL